MEIVFWLRWTSLFSHRILIFQPKITIVISPFIVGTDVLQFFSWCISIINFNFQLHQEVII